MPVADQPRAEGDRPELDVRVAPSAAVELHWVTMTEAPDRLRITHPIVADMAARRPDLVERLSSFWRDAAPGGAETVTARSFPELLVLADRAGQLTTTDFGELVAGMGRVASRAAADPALASEPPGDRDLVVDRLRRLRASAPLRQAWTALLTEVADLVGPRWLDSGLDVSRRAARARASQLPWTDPAGAVLGWARRDYDGVLPELLAAATSARRPVLVVPSYWSGNGLVFDLDRHLLVGIPAQFGPADSRARTEPWARGLRALADPTRLAIVDYLGGTVRSISDLAADFGLAQPTASRHVRILREAGLISEVRNGSTVYVSADAAALRRLVDGLAAVLSERSRPPGAPG